MFKIQTFDQLMARMMDLIPDALDKRQGSIVYNALSPVAAEMAQMYVAMLIFVEQTYLGTAIGENLDARALDFSIERRLASSAFRIAATFDNNSQPFNVPIGSRFSVPNMQIEVTYVVREYTGVGICIIECEQPGAVGNAHTGLLLPVFPVNNLGLIEITGTHIPGRDDETDDAYRQRVIDRLRQKEFGGNIADYKEFVGAINGVGDLKVFPAWQGGGTVLISVVDSDYSPVSSEFIQYVKNIVDPVEYTGQGVGTAPIGHEVTVMTPAPYNINVYFEATLDSVTSGQIQADAEARIREYIRSVRMGWADTNITWIYVSRVIEALHQVPGVVSIRNLTLNGSPNDISLVDTTDTQYLPQLESVIIG